MESLRILMVADIHYIHHAIHISSIENRKTQEGKFFLEKVLEAEKENIDLILLLGDILDNGNAFNAEKDALEIKALLDESQVPYRIVFGNHDGNQEMIQQVFEAQPGCTIVNGYNIVTFFDEYDQNDVCTRSMDHMNRLFDHIQSSHPTLVFQHNPLYPAIDSPYPYQLTDAEKIMQIYEKNQVLYSASGHYHKGIHSNHINHVEYLTIPALCEFPFSYAIATVEEQTVQTHVHVLAK